MPKLSSPTQPANYSNSQTSKPQLCIDGQISGWETEWRMQVKTAVVLPAIALAEAVWIVERGKTSIPSVVALLSAINADPRVIVYPLDQAVIEQTITLSAIHEMHGRQVVATAIVIQSQGEMMTLLTCDENIAASGLVSIAW